MNPLLLAPELRADAQALADGARRFAQAELAPHITAWDAAGAFPRALYARAADMGWLGLGYPEALGGTPAPLALRCALTVALSRWGASGGLMASLFSHNISLPLLLAQGSAALQAEVVPPVLRGEAIAALAITEPGGGSDVANLRTTAVRDGGDYVLNGEKVFITSGLRADWFTVAVRTHPQAKGAAGISLIAVPGDSAGLSRSRLDKMGWWCSDTAHLRFDQVRVPARFLVGEEGTGFRAIMANFNGERVALAGMALGFAQACFDEALAWAQQRQAFGRTLNEQPVIRHKLADMAQRIAATEAWLAAVAARHDQGDHSPDWVAQVCLLKNHATQAFQQVVDQSVQILGGMGYMRGTVSERLYREVKVLTIGGGTEEIMKDLAARQFGW